MLRGLRRQFSFVSARAELLTGCAYVGSLRCLHWRRGGSARARGGVFGLQRSSVRGCTRHPETALASHAQRPAVPHASPKGSLLQRPRQDCAA